MFQSFTMILGTVAILKSWKSCDQSCSVTWLLAAVFLINNKKQAEKIEDSNDVSFIFLCQLLEVLLNVWWIYAFQVRFWSTLTGSTWMTLTFLETRRCFLSGDDNVYYVSHSAISRMAVQNTSLSGSGAHLGPSDNTVGTQICVHLDFLLNRRRCLSTKNSN